MNLYDAIIKIETPSASLAYMRGFQDARNCAAELASAAEALDPAPYLLVALVALLDLLQRELEIEFDQEPPSDKEYFAAMDQARAAIAKATK